MSFEKNTLKLLPEALQIIDKAFNHLPEFEPEADTAKIRSVLMDVAERLQDNYPYHHPLYAGQMLKPPHPVARLAYTLAMWINPNNHALDGGRASSAMEKEVVAQLAAMFNWPEHLGHLTSGGTMANLEGLWISGKLHPDKFIAASELAHYTHSRISEVLKIPFKTIEADSSGRMDLTCLENELKNGNIGTVVVNIGTTGLGSIDPLPEILKLQRKYRFRIHADAAYGGYFTLCQNLSPAARRTFDALTRVDSIVIDPHKHGLQPYGCGCILFADPSVGRFYKHDSPYTYFTSGDLHLGEISLECSRPGASAVALWATMKLLPLVTGGEFALRLENSCLAAQKLYARIIQDRRLLAMLPPELDIVTWAPKAEKISVISQLSVQLFETAAHHNLHLALFKCSVDKLPPAWQSVEKDQDTVTCLRSCLMKPEHVDWLDQIWQILDSCLDKLLKSGAVD